VIPSCAEQKYPSADQTLFSGEFVSYLGPKLRTSPTRLKSLVQPSDYYLFQLFHVGTDDVTTKILRSIKRDFRDMGKRLKHSAAQAAFSSILPVKAADFRRNRRAQDINTWLQDLCLCQNSGILNHGRAFKTQGMLGSDRIQLSQWEKDIFGCKLTGVIERSLN